MVISLHTEKAFNKIQHPEVSAVAQLANSLLASTSISIQTQVHVLAATFMNQLLAYDLGISER